MYRNRIRTSRRSSSMSEHVIGWVRSSLKTKHGTTLCKPYAAIVSEKTATVASRRRRALHYSPATTRDGLSLSRHRKRNNVGQQEHTRQRRSNEQCRRKGLRGIYVRVLFRERRNQAGIWDIDVFVQSIGEGKKRPHPARLWACRFTRLTTQLATVSGGVGAWILPPPVVEEWA
jgi:hypothetical protein